MILFKVLSFLFLCFSAVKSDCAQSKRLSTSKLICYYGDLEQIDGCFCTHVILPTNADVKAIERVREKLKGVKVYVAVNEFNQDLIDLLKSSKFDGLDLNLKKLSSKDDISDLISTIKTKIGTDLEIALSVPAKSELVAKYFDFKALSKQAEMFILQTAFLGPSTNVTFHPSRLSGMWDMQNTDSVVDLVTGLGAPLSKLAIAAPVQAFQFKLQNEEYTAPGSPALELNTISRNELCELMKQKDWTLERDEDQAGPYIFSKDQWIAFEDSKSIDIKAKYARVRGLAGIALKDLSQDTGSACESSMLEAAFNGLNKQSRAPRGAVLHSLEREIADNSVSNLNNVHLSPYKISRIIDTEGKIHVTRQDTRTEFQCSRQGYFVHPRSCNRFYRCVKFNQQTEDYNVFEFDCPAGLAFDERVEVCVWPGSLPHGTPCSGSSEIAPVPRQRFECPSEPGYYADPENCRWFFACMDHGKSPLSAYEFRCPFGLVFDGERLMCEWPWLVPKCGNGGSYNSEYHYGSGEVYSSKGAQSTGLMLENYEGLGALKSVKLGGVVGTLNKPIATVYSNVGGVGLGYQNSGGYIEGGGLSYKAAQSLQHAGLLKVDNGAGYQYENSVSGSSQYDGHNQYQQTQQIIGQSNYGAAASGAASADSHNDDTGIYVADNNIDINAGSYASSHNNKAQSSYIAQPDHSSGVAGNVNIIGGGYSAVASLSNVESAQNEQYQVGIVSGVPAVTAIPLPGIRTVAGVETFNGGVIANTPELQYRVKSFTNSGSANHNSTSFANFVSSYHQPSIVSSPAGNIESHVVVSAFAPTDANIHHEFVNNLNYVYNGGAVASGHEQHRETSGYQNHDLILSTPAPIAAVEVQEKQIHISSPAPVVSIHQQYQTGGGYEYNKNTAGFQEDEVSVSTAAPVVIQQQYASNGGYGYKQPSVAFEERPVIVSSPAPSVLQTYDNNRGYKYDKPTVTFEESPKNIVVNTYSQQHQTGISSTSATPVASYNYIKQTPTIISKFSIRKPTVQLYHQPQLVSTYSYQQPVSKYTYKDVVQQSLGTSYQHQQNEAASYQYTNQQNNGGEVSLTQSTPRPFAKTQTIDSGYVYTKPSVAFVDKPVNVQPVVSTYHDQVDSRSYGTGSYAKSEGYTYTQPSVKSQEVPEQHDVVNNNYINIHGGSQHQQNVDNSYAKSEGYVYSQPSVKFEEVPVGYSTAAPVQPAVVTNYVNIDNGNQQFSTGTSYAKSEGYTYSQPSVRFEEAPVSYSTSRPTGGTSYIDIHKSEGYTYPQPSVKFEEVPASYSTPAPVKPALVTSYFHIDNSRTQQQDISAATRTKSEGYSHSQPSVTFPAAVQVKPAEVNNYFNIDVSKSQHVVASNSQSDGYHYSQPSVKFEEAPVSYSTPKPGPAVVTSYFNTGSAKSQEQHIGTSYHKSEGYTYSQPSVKFEEAPVRYSTPKPAPAVVTSYFNTDSSKSQEQHADTSYDKSEGYTYSQPSVKFEEVPASYSTPPPAKPAVVTSYFNIDNSKSQQHDISGVGYRKSEGYSHPITYPAAQVKPAEVNSYFNTDNSKSEQTFASHAQSEGYHYSQPSARFEDVPISYPTPKPSPAVVSSYFKIDNSKSKNVGTSYSKSEGYVYNQPSVKLQEIPIVSSTPKPAQAIETSYFNIDNSRSQEYHSQSESYTYPKPSVKFQEIPVTPTIVNSYNIDNHQQHIGTQNSKSEEYIYSQEVQKPAVVSSYFNIGSKTNSVHSTVSSTPKPNFINIISSTPKTSTAPQTLITYKQSPKSVLGGSYSYTAQTTVQPQVPYSYEKQQPTVVYNPFDYTTPQPQLYVEEPKAAVVTSYRKEGYNYPKPQIKFEEVQVKEPVFVKKTAYVTGQYQQEDNYNYDNYERVKQVIYGQKIQQSTPKPTFSSTIRTVARKYSSTPAPARAYLPVTTTEKYSTTPTLKTFKVVENFVAPAVTTLSREYLPARVKSTTPSREYLPVEVTTPSREYLPVVKITPNREYLPSKSSTIAPEITTLNREYLPAKTRVKITSTTPKATNTIRARRPVTVIKQNDAHPLLSAKLGAQCTCVSNTLTLRKKQKVIIVEDDDDDNDGYEVDDGGDTYEAQRIVDVTPSPEVSSQQPVYIKKRVRTRPVTQATDIFLKEVSSTPSDKEIVKAVKTGLNLVKQAAKEGARQGTEEVLTKFDRYGPGGVRSRAENLQGTVDCQRAGLFRHPTECNKFYACRWDCTKKRFTLHVFNCPVHLTFDNNLGACNWPSQGPACVENTLITSD